MHSSCGTRISPIKGYSFQIYASQKRSVLQEKADSVATESAAKFTTQQCFANYFLVNFAAKFIMLVSFISHMCFLCSLCFAAIELQIQRLEKLLNDSQNGISAVTSHAESLKNATDKLSQELDRVQRQLTVVTGQYTSLQVCNMLWPLHLLQLLLWFLSVECCTFKVCLVFRVNLFMSEPRLTASYEGV
jgi:hypothetical protein